MKRSRRLTQEEYEKMKQLYIAENVGLPELVEQFNTTYSKIYTRYSQEGWKRLRRDFDAESGVMIKDDAVERSLKSARSKDDEHKAIASEAVTVAMQCLSLMKKQLKRIQDFEKKIESGQKLSREELENAETLDALSVQRSINALKEAVHLERITHNLPTGVIKSDVTSGGMPLQQNIPQLLQSDEMMSLAKQLGVTDVKYIEGIALKIADNASDEG